MRMALVFLVLLVEVARAGSGGADGARPGWVIGTLRYDDGRAIEGARFRVELVSEETGEVVSATDEVDVTGQYALRLPAAGRYRVRAAANLDLNAPEVIFQLGAIGGEALNADPARGALKSFLLVPPVLMRTGP